MTHEGYRPTEGTMFMLPHDPRQDALLAINLSNTPALTHVSNKHRSFDGDDANGLNLGKLFSVYEPNSIQKRNLKSEFPRKQGIQSKSQQGRRTSSNDNGLLSHRTRGAKLGKTQDMDGDHYTMHMQLLKNILKDHTL